MNSLDEYQRQRTINLLGLRAFPRSLGMIAGAISLAISLNPDSSLTNALTVWFFAYLIKSILAPTIVETNLWSCCSLPVNAIGAWPIRWFLYISLVLIALYLGAPTSQTLLFMGGLLAYDFIITIFFRV